MFLADFRDAFSGDPNFYAEGAFRKMLSVMRLHAKEGEMDRLHRVPPDPIKALWLKEF